MDRLSLKLFAAALALILFACNAKSDTDTDPNKPTRTGFAASPVWTYPPQAIVGSNAGSGHIENGSVKVDKAETSGFLNGPVLKFCQPLFTGHGDVDTAMTILVNAKNAARDDSKPEILYVQLSAVSTATGFPIVDVRSYNLDELNEGQWINVHSAIVIPAAATASQEGATNVCLSVSTYPLAHLAVGNFNPLLNSLWISSTVLNFHQNF